VKPGLAEAPDAHRNACRPVRARRDVPKVARHGPKTLDQAAGFPPLSGGAEPLAASAVRPEASDLARRILAACGRDLRDVLAKPGLLRRLDLAEFTDARSGLPTVLDILSEVERPGGDRGRNGPCQAASANPSGNAFPTGRPPRASVTGTAIGSSALAPPPRSRRATAGSQHRPGRWR